MMSLYTNFHQDWTKSKTPLQRGTILNLKSDGWCILSVSLTTRDAIMITVGRSVVESFMYKDCCVSSTRRVLCTHLCSYHHSSTTWFNCCRLCWPSKLCATHWIICIWLLKAVLKICAKWNTMIRCWFESPT